jgi:soluble lytic murein transglycosylase
MLKKMLAAVCLLPVALAAQPADPAALAARRSAFLADWQAARSGRLDAAGLARQAGHPLLGWLEARQLAARLAVAQGEEVRVFFARYDQQPAGLWLRNRWIVQLATRQDWAAVSALGRPGLNAEARCAVLHARTLTGELDAEELVQAREWWLSERPQPAHCETAFQTLVRRGQIDNAAIWARLEAAAGAGQAGLMRQIAVGLFGDEVAEARRYADHVANPTARAAAWPASERSRRFAAIGVARIARRNPAGAEALLAQLAPLRLGETDRGRVLYEAALWTVASYGAGSATRLNAVPDVSYDEKLHEWRVREALARGDDAAAIAAIEKMGATQRGDARWQYFEARLRERVGQREAAQALYAKAAQSPTFHGFLAADRLGVPYALCPLEASADPLLVAGIGGVPGLVRAFELWRIDEPELAVQEWTAALARLDDTGRRVAVDLAIQAHWYDRSVFGLRSDNPEDQRHYRLRFPLHHDSTLRAEALRRGLDPAWVAAQTRAESAFMPRARSGADARGLLQLLPATAAQVSRATGLRYEGPGSLYDPEINLPLGVAYLRMMLDRQNGQAYQAIAAYNAGPGAVDRWQAARPNLDTDFWIETIPYKETRDYVARVLAFSVIYDWRLEGRARRVSDRMQGRFDPQAPQVAFQCPLPPATPPAAPTTP